MCSRGDSGRTIRDLNRDVSTAMEQHWIFCRLTTSVVGEIRHQRNSGQPDAGLCGRAALGLHVSGIAENPRRVRLSTCCLLSGSITSPPPPWELSDTIARNTLHFLSCTYYFLNYTF